MMCVIIDANVAHQFGSPHAHQDAQPVLIWLNMRKGHLALGGKVTVELFRTPIRRWIRELLRSGVALLYDKADLDSAQDWVVASQQCQSDDTHIIALARVSGARLLYSSDARLVRDFKNRALLNTPRGKVYSSYRNRRLLSNCPPCRDP